VFTLGLLSICIEYGPNKWLAIRDEITVLELDMQLIGNQNSRRKWVRTTEDIRVLALEVQPISSVYDLDTRLALSNEILVFSSTAWTIAQTGDRYGSSTLYPGQVLSGSHFRRQVPLRLQRRKRT